jgi:hypothetical protein
MTLFDHLVRVCAALNNDRMRLGRRDLVERMKLEEIISQLPLFQFRLVNKNINGAKWNFDAWVCAAVSSRKSTSMSSCNGFSVKKTSSRFICKMARTNSFSPHQRKSIGRTQNCRPEAGRPTSAVRSWRLRCLHDRPDERSDPTEHRPAENQIDEKIMPPCCALRWPAITARRK